MRSASSNETSTVAGLYAPRRSGHSPDCSPGLHFPYASLTLHPCVVPILRAPMRLVLASLAALAFAVPLGVAAARPAGSLSVEDGRGVVTLRGKGIVIGRLERGELQIVDLSPLDQWSPRVNGVPRGRTVGMRGKDVNFYVPGGRYRITVTGTGFSISARGQGTATLDGSADPVGATGTYAVGDAEPLPLPEELATIYYGAPLVVKSAVVVGATP